MKAIDANPKKIRELFLNNKFIIPEYQRRYSWDVEQCVKLWEDLEGFSDSASDSDKYFLGSLVVYPENDFLHVIDGQQRLTTLILLLKSLFDAAGTFQILESCLKLTDPKNGKVTDDIRLKSLVFEDDSNQLISIINNLQYDETSNYGKNFKKFEELLKTWKTHHTSVNELEKLILDILDKVVILPITCESFDDAIVLFETVNDRGMPLDDSDIFKASIYSSLHADDRAQFIDHWNSFTNHEWLFRVHMHVTRAMDGEAGKEIALRKYFYSTNYLTSKSMPIINCFEIYSAFKTWEPNHKISALLKILSMHNNKYWHYPLIVFIAKYGRVTEDGDLALDSNGRYFQFEKLAEDLLKYFVVKAFVYNSVNVVKDFIFKISAEIWQGEALEKSIKKEYSKDKKQFLQILNEEIPSRYQKMLTILAAYLNPNQNLEDFNMKLSERIEIEHILPKKWCNFDKWDKRSWSLWINKIGNICTIEKSVNISASNEFFVRKKKAYSKSFIQDIIDLNNNPIDNWHLNSATERQNEIISRFDRFLD